MRAEATNPALATLLCKEDEEDLDLARKVSSNEGVRKNGSADGSEEGDGGGGGNSSKEGE